MRCCAGLSCGRGRAATITEAIDAHGGEAAGVGTAFRQLPARAKVQLLTFLRSLRVPSTQDVERLLLAGQPATVPEAAPRF